MRKTTCSCKIKPVPIISSRQTRLPTNELKPTPLSCVAEHALENAGNELQWRAGRQSRARLRGLGPLFRMPPHPPLYPRSLSSPPLHPPRPSLTLTPMLGLALKLFPMLNPRQVSTRNHRALPDFENCDIGFCFIRTHGQHLHCIWVHHNKHFLAQVFPALIFFSSCVALPGQAVGRLGGRASVGNGKRSYPGLRCGHWVQNLHEKVIYCIQRAVEPPTFL